MNIISCHTDLNNIDFRKENALLVDKPKGWTSFDVVNKIRFNLKSLYRLQKFKVGHAGTLDPQATGLLIVCTGKGTKKVTEFLEMDKRYEGEIQFGATTDSYDSETEINAEYPTSHLNSALLMQTTQEFTGRISQYPPIFSAIKKGGIPLYKLARQGEKPKVEPREVFIHEFTIGKFKENVLTFEIQCSKGTYIRSIAHDFGKVVGSGAYLKTLERTSIGPYKLSDAWVLPDLIEKLDELT